jgi:hypothetical protein
VCMPSTTMFSASCLAWVDSLIAIRNF